MNNILSHIRIKYNILSPAQKKVADYVLQNPRDVIVYTLNELSSYCNVSETSVIRFINKLGYDSYQLFKVHLAQFLPNMGTSQLYDDTKIILNPDNINTEAIIIKTISSTIRAVKDSIHSIDHTNIELLIDKIINAENILLIGVGSSAAIAKDGFHKLIKYGYRAIYMDDPHFINIYSNILTNKDLLICISHSGESREIIDGLKFARENQCTVAAITSYAKSTIARKSDILLLSSSFETTYKSDALLSRIIQLVIIDIVYSYLGIINGTDGSSYLQKSRIATAKNKT